MKTSKLKSDIRKGTCSKTQTVKGKIVPEGLCRAEDIIAAAASKVAEILARKLYQAGSLSGSATARRGGACMELSIKFTLPKAGRRKAEK